MSIADRRGRPAPFGHLFAVDGRDHFYDVHTNGLVEIAPVLAAVLPLHGPRSRRSIVAELAPRFGSDAVREAFAAIERGRRERGLFRARRPRLVPPPARWARAGECDRDLQHLVLTVTERCNLRCRYCVHGAGLGWVRPHGTTAMPPGVAVGATRWFLDRADREQAPVISFYGGEALLEPGLVAAVVDEARAHAEGSRVRFAIDTNGVLLDDRIIDLVLRERMYLQVSLDGPAAVHDLHRVDGRGAPTHAHIEAGLDRLLARDRTAAARLSIMATLAPPAEVAAVAAYFAEFPPFRRHGIAGAPRLRIGVADLRGQAWPATPADRQALVAGLAAEQARFLDAMSAGDRHAAGPVAAALAEPTLVRWRHRSRAPLGRAWVPGGNCRPGRRKVHVLPDGTFHPCERTGSVMPIGRAGEGLDSSRVRALDLGFHAAVGPGCRDCWALRLCGICYAAQAGALRDDTGQGGPLETVCAAQRRAQEQALVLVARTLQMPPGTRSWLADTQVR